MLLRTVHSILKRTPPELLSEIIMVNDNSPNDDLQEPLEKYVRYLPSKVMGIRAVMLQLFTCCWSFLQNLLHIIKRYIELIKAKDFHWWLVNKYFLNMPGL